MRYLQLAAKALELHIELLQDRNNPRIEKGVREFHEGIEAQLDNFPPLDMSRYEESRARWEAAGIKSSSVLRQIAPEQLNWVLPTAMKPGANAVKLEGEDVKKLMEALKE
ncbi:MAG: hypothetical protein ACK4F7_00750 [Inhella sp.]